MSIEIIMARATVDANKQLADKALRKLKTLDLKMNMHSKTSTEYQKAKAAYDAAAITTRVALDTLDESLKKLIALSIHHKK